MPRNHEFDRVVLWIDNFLNWGLLHEVQSRPKVWQMLTNAVQNDDPDGLSKAIEKADFYGLLTEVWNSKHGDLFQKAMMAMDRKRGKSASDFRGKLIRLAYARPELRPRLLPLLSKTAGVSERDIENVVKMWDKVRGSAGYSIPVKHGALSGRLDVTLLSAGGKYAIKMQGPAGELPMLKGESPRAILDSLLVGRMKPVGEAVIKGLNLPQGQPMPPWEKRRHASQPRMGAWPKGLPKPSIQARNAPVPRNSRSKFHTDVRRYLNSVYSWMTANGVPRDKALGWMEWVWPFIDGSMSSREYHSPVGQKWNLQKQTDVVTYLQQGVPEEAQHLAQQYGAARSPGSIDQAVAAAEKLDDMQAVVAMALVGDLWETASGLVNKLKSGKDKIPDDKYKLYLKAIQVASRLKLPQKF